MFSTDNQPEIYADENAESFIVGTCLIYTHEIDAVSEVLPDGEMFMNPTLGAVYDAMVTVYNRNGGRLDTAMLLTELAQRGVEMTGEELVEYARSHGHGANLDIHAKRVRKCWQVRNAWATINDSLYRLKQDPEDVESVLSSSLDDITAVSSFNAASDIVTASALADRIEQQIREGAPSNAIPTGFPTIDGWLRGGVRPGEVMVIGGRPGQGKTALGVNMAMLTAAKGNPSAILSIEMSAEEIGRRMMAVCGCPMNANQSDLAKAAEARARLNEMPVSVVDMPKGELAQIRSHVRTLSRIHGVRLFVIDYVQLVKTGKANAEEYQRVTMASQAIKQIAREYGVAILALAQVNRDGGKKERPTMADLKGSGSLEQDADQIVLVHNPPNDPEAEPELILAKHRNGRTGTVAVEYRAAQTRFIDLGEKTWTEQKNAW